MQINQACKQAYVTEFTDKLPNKLWTKVGPRGSNLSGGQRQRVNIARALLRDSPIFLLDEATASLDSKSEELVQHALKRVAKGRTTLLITHRVSTISDVDKIIILQDGQVVDQGTHSELYKKRGLYFDLFNGH